MERKEAIEIVRKLYNDSLFLKKDKEAMVTLIPELKESEDEKIVNALIGYLEGSVHDVNEVIIPGIKVSDAIAWLEKQGEQKPVDKIEPKFKVGDWIIHNKNIELANSLMLVTGKDNNEYLCKDINGQCSYNIELIDSNYHLWTIQDAKDGDVLHSTGWHNDCIFIFNGLDNWKFDEPNGDRAVATGYCCLSVSADKMKFGIQGPDCVEVNTINPATKMQRDLLFQKMKEVGYEWDAEKKELKKIEQSLAWNDGDEKEFEQLLDILHANGYESFDIWLKSLKERYTWRPSERDLGSLTDAIIHYEGIGINPNGLKELFEQLKKLREK